MARSGGRYVLENGKRRLVSNTQHQPRKNSVAPARTVVADPKKTDTETTPQPAVASVSATAKEAK